MPRPRVTEKKKVLYDQLKVGQHVGKFLSRLIRETGADPKNIHLVGHSLGSHVAAHIGRAVQRSGLGSLGRISALDPAKPWFDGSNRPERIGRHDAEFVDVIHTNSGEIYQVTVLLDNAPLNSPGNVQSQGWKSLQWTTALAYFAS